MGHKGRGAEGQVRCEKCGRLTRRDKAVYIDKVMLSNPLDRNQVQDPAYKRVFSREVAYCPSCGKHGRIYDKKIKQMERERAFAEERASRPRQRYGDRNSYGNAPVRPAPSAKPAAPAAPAPAAPASEESEIAPESRENPQEQQ
ncbi:hypothetical protein HY995_03190 [Candidatus Micrarchaeota archaeon]|nr:hypothetical protein [Candidatus Micrarchaeota archaeon]MBI5177067.1 hypothetical protein [Candidatus Micrarchaeota archaeon]